MLTTVIIFTALASAVPLAGKAPPSADGASEIRCSVTPDRDDTLGGRETASGKHRDEKRTLRKWLLIGIGVNPSRRAGNHHPPLVVARDAGDRPAPQPAKGAHFLRLLRHGSSGLGEQREQVANPDSGDDKTTAFIEDARRRFPLLALPLERRVESLFLLQPGTSESEGFYVARGMPARRQAILVDGIDITSPLTGLDGATLPVEAIDRADGALHERYTQWSAQYPQAAMRITTRCGTDAIAGEAGLYWLKSDFAEIDGVSVGPYRRESTASATLGGPLLKGKMWFFGACSYESGRNLVRPTITLPREHRGPSLLMKLDFAPADSSTSLSPAGKALRFLYLGSFVGSKHFWAPDGSVVTSQVADASQSASDLVGSSHFVSLAAEKTWSNGSSAAVRIDYARRRETLEPTSGDRPVATVIDPLAPGGAVLKQGSIQPLWRDDSENKIALSGSAACTLSALGVDHDVWIHGTLERIDFTLGSGYNGGCYYEFFQPEDRLVRRTSFLQNGRDYLRDGRFIRRYALTLGDGFSAFGGLLGARIGLDIESVKAGNGQADIFRWTTLNPNLALQLRLFRDDDGNVIFARAGYRRAGERILGADIPGEPYDIVTEFYDTYTGSWSTSSLNSLRRAGYDSASVDSELNRPEWREWTIGFAGSRQTGRDNRNGGVLNWSVDYIHRLDTGIIDTVETNLRPNYSADTRDDRDDNEYTYYVAGIGADGTRNPFFLLTNPEGAWRRYRGLELSLSGRLSGGLNILAALTLSATEGDIDNTLEESTADSPAFDSPNERTNARGYLSSDRRSVSLLGVSYVTTAWGGLAVSAYYRHSSGRPFDKLLLNPDTGRYEIRSAPRGSLYRLPGESVLNVGVEKRLPLPPLRGDLSLRLDVLNALGERAPTGVVKSELAFALPLEYQEPRAIRLGLRYVF